MILEVTLTCILMQDEYLERWCLGLVYFCRAELRLGEGLECPFILVSSFGVYLLLTFIRLSLRAMLDDCW